MKKDLIPSLMRLSDEETTLHPASLHVVMKGTCFTRACNDVNQAVDCRAEYGCRIQLVSLYHIAIAIVIVAAATGFSLSSACSWVESSSNNYARIQDSLRAEPVRAEPDIH